VTQQQNLSVSEQVVLLNLVALHAYRNNSLLLPNLWPTFLMMSL
jgi:hypothetical protein